MSQLNFEVEQQQEVEIRAIAITRPTRDLLAQFAEKNADKIHGQLIQIIVDAWDTEAE